MDEPAIERYLNVRHASNPSFGPAGERLSFLLSPTGVPQVWSLDEPLGWPTQQTFFDERITFASFSPERPELIFGMDEGGNERIQLYRLDLDNGQIENLTRHPDAKHHWGGFSHDGERFTFTSNRRDTAVFDVYVQERDEVGSAASLVYETDGWFWPLGWSNADDRLLLAESDASYDWDLYVLDVETEHVRHLTPHEEEFRYRWPNWAPDDEGLYLVTDRDSDTLYMAYLDLETLEIHPVVDGGEWNVSAVRVHGETGRFVSSRNVDGYTELTVGEFDADEPTTFETFPTPDLPAGVAGGVKFDPEGGRFALSATTDTDNRNVYVVDIETGETTRWTDASTAGIPRETFRESELVRIESFDGRKIPGFLTLPADADGSPVVVDIHGGPVSQRRPAFSSVKQYFVARGYAVFEPNVRGSAGYGREYASLDDVEKRMDAVTDIEACVEWLRTHPAVDPDRIACMGGSYGGFMVLAALTEYPDLWAAGVDIVGIANFVTFLEKTGDWRRSHRESEYGSLEDDRDVLEAISPINTVDRIEAPLFVLHGANDPRVPVSEAEQIVEAVAERDVPVEKLIFEDEGHGFSKRENRIEAYAAIADFLDEHV